MLSGFADRKSFIIGIFHFKEIPRMNELLKATSMLS